MSGVIVTFTWLKVLSLKGSYSQFVKGGEDFSSYSLQGPWTGERLSGGL